MSTIRLLISLVSSKGWHLHQLDVNTTFLHGDLDEEVYMACPPGLLYNHSNLVCKLNKYIYHLKQDNRQWNNKLTSILIDLSFTQLKSDYSLFIKKHNIYFTAILVYVDDLIVASTNSQETTHVKYILDTNFKINYLGDLRFFLVLKSQGILKAFLYANENTA